MVTVLVIGLSVVLQAFTPASQAESTADTDAAVAIVMRLLDALRRDDFDTAYGFASARVRGLVDRARFETLVRGYPEMARAAKAVVVERARGPNGSLRLRLEISGADGRTIDAVYEMVRESGEWKVNAVVIRGPDLPGSTTEQGP